MAKMLDTVPLATWKTWLKYPRRPPLCRPAEQGLRRRGVRLFRHDAPRRSAAATALETRRDGRGRRPRRGGGQALRGEALSAPGQAADGRNGQERHGRLPRQHPERRLADAPRRRTRRWPSWPRSRPRSAIPRNGGTTRRWKSAATTWWATWTARRSTSGTATSTSSASRSIATSGT